MHDVFTEWNEGKLDSYLIEITRDILGYQDQNGEYVVDKILDTAGQKGTGKWTSVNALDMGTPAPTIAEAVFARCISAIKEERTAASKLLQGPETAKYNGDKTELIEAIRQALYASKICSYAQGFQLMRDAEKEYGWNLNFGEIARIFRGGCIIRAAFLQKITEAFEHDPKLANLLLDPYFTQAIHNAQPSWRKVIALAAQHGVPAPTFSSALAYYDSYRTARLPQNLLQAQRDFFGAHTYERTDKAAGEFFHTQWPEVIDWKRVANFETWKGGFRAPFFYDITFKPMKTFIGSIEEKSRNLQLNRGKLMRNTIEREIKKLSGLSLNEKAASPRISVKERTPLNAWTKFISLLIIVLEGKFYEFRMWKCIVKKLVLII